MIQTVGSWCPYLLETLTEYLNQTDNAVVYLSHIRIRDSITVYSDPKPVFFCRKQSEYNRISDPNVGEKHTIVAL